MSLPYLDLESESPEQLYIRAYEQAYDNGWTDGLPIVPVTPEAVQRFVEASGRPADDLVATLPPRKGRATVELIAANAVIAGCRPEYMPLIIAAIEALADPHFPLEHMQVTTNPMAPFVLVNGPIRHQLDINFSTGCLGPGWRANATIGRAVRLILINGGEAVANMYSKSSFASPLRFSFLCGENEEANPWNPFHVDRGFRLEQNTVTVFRAFTFCSLSGGFGVGASEILRHIASHMLPIYVLGDGAVLLLGVNRAEALHKAGLTKSHIQQELWKLARLPKSYFANAFCEGEVAAGRGDAETIWRVAKPEDIYVVVAGGPGPQDAYIAAGMPQTRLIGESH